jgi:hypothetical protein
MLWKFTCDWLKVITFLTFGRTNGLLRGGECNRYNIICYNILYISLFIHVSHVIHISWDILLPIYLYLLTYLMELPWIG